MLSTSACSYLHCALNPGLEWLDISTNIARSGNLYSCLEIAVYEAPPSLTTSNFPSNSGAALGGIGVCTKSVWCTHSCITFHTAHQATCTAIDTGFQILMWMDQYENVPLDTVNM